MGVSWMCDCMSWLCHALYAESQFASSHEEMLAQCGVRLSMDATFKIARGGGVQSNGKWHNVEAILLNVMDEKGKVIDWCLAKSEHADPMRSMLERIFLYKKTKILPQVKSVSTDDAQRTSRLVREVYEKIELKGSNYQVPEPPKLLLDRWHARKRVLLQLRNVHPLYEQAQDKWKMIFERMYPASDQSLRGLRPRPPPFGSLAELRHAFITYRNWCFTTSVDNLDENSASKKLVGNLMEMMKNRSVDGKRKVD